MEATFVVSELAQGVCEATLRPTTSPAELTGFEKEMDGGNDMTGLVGTSFPRLCTLQERKKDFRLFYGSHYDGHIILRVIEVAWVRQQKTRAWFRDLLN